MSANSASTTSEARHFDRGPRLATALATVWLLLAACSGNLDNRNQPGTAGTAGDGGTTGSGAIGGTTPTGSTCMMGTANYCGTTPTGGVGGVGGTGGSAPLPVCDDGAPVFGVCFVNDADVLPLPAVPVDVGTSTNGTITATIVDVGIGSAPAQCESARWFGDRGTIEWWFQARSADNRLWTIGLSGLGNVQLVRRNDNVTLNLAWRGFGPGVGFGPPSGRLELSSASATPLLWAGANATASSTGWLELAPGQEVCWPNDMPCDLSRKNVKVTVNGIPATVAPFNADNLGGYYVAVGEIVETQRSVTNCVDYYGPPFAAAAVKIFPDDP